MLTDIQIEALYQKRFPDGMTWEGISNKLARMHDEYTDELRVVFCNQLLYQISSGYTKYDFETLNKKSSDFIDLFCENVEQLPSGYYYFHSLKYFFERCYDECLKLIEAYLEKTSAEINEHVLADTFFDPFKQAFPGFWGQLSKFISRKTHNKQLSRLCEIIDQYYLLETDESVIDLLLLSTAEMPKSILIKELLAITYYSMKKWNNALAYFEQTEEERVLIFDHQLYFMMAWSHNKIKNHAEEEKYYKKCLECDPNNIDARNNLGYCYYSIKKYDLAIAQFNQCLDIDSQYSYAADNIIRVMIATGKYKDAKAFIEEGYNVSTALRRKVDKLKSENIIVPVSENVDDLSSEVEHIRTPKDLGVKRQQFSSEKLLEDELTARIEAGIDVFGLKLRVYKRHGEYGRQFIIPVGRLDLLCEDDSGNLYIIELKKDSGYDDAYKQTAEYLDWFEKSKYAKGRKIYGIICLNSPSNELIKKVHADSRMRLFEYQISYREV